MIIMLSVRNKNYHVTIIFFVFVIYIFAVASLSAFIPLHCVSYVSFGL